MLMLMFSILSFSQNFEGISGLKYMSSDTIDNEDVFIWRGDIIKKDSIVYVENKIDSIRVKYIHGGWSKWLPNTQKIKTWIATKEPIQTKGNLTESVAGLEFNATRQVIGGAAQLSLSTGYQIPTTTQIGQIDHSNRTALDAVSGTNTGDNAANTTSNTYADGKISDATYSGSWDAATTIAPSKNSVYDKIETLIPINYCAATMVVDRGTLNSGTVSDLCAVGETDVNIQEITGTDPLRVTFTFTGVNRVDGFKFYGRYNGSTQHVINAEAWNYSTSAWDFLGNLSTTTGKQWYVFILNLPNNYLSSNTVQIRLVHQGSGQSSHQLILDYVNVNYGGGGGTGFITAGAVSNSPNDNIAATNVQAAINELDAEKQPLLTNPVIANASSFSANKLIKATGIGNQTQETAITVDGSNNVSGINFLRGASVKASGRIFSIGNSSFDDLTSTNGSIVMYYNSSIGGVITTSNYSTATALPLYIEASKLQMPSGTLFQYENGKFAGSILSGDASGNISHKTINQAIGGNALSTGYLSYWDGSKLANLTSQYIDWNATSGATSIANKPTFLISNIQLLSGTTPTYDVNLGVDATITLSGNTTITLSSLIAGMKGTLYVQNASTSYALNIAGYPNVISKAVGTIGNTTKLNVTGVSGFDVFSWSYTGTIVVWNGNLDYIK